MASLGKAVLYGVGVWAIPFAVAFVIFPLRQSARPLFESLMPIAIAGAVVGFAVPYFRRVRAVFVGEGLRVGLLWVLICMAIDAPLMLFGGPMKMTIGQYMADIGVAYLMIPVITLGIGAAVAQSRARDAA